MNKLINMVRHNPFFGILFALFLIIILGFAIKLFLVKFS